jgi:hypothetical protein
MPTIELSTLDQHATREYHRFALVFACSDSTDPISTTERLQTIVKKTVSELPVLAGTVHDGNKVSIDRLQINDFAATILPSEVTALDYATLCAAGFPPSRLTAERLTPLADTPYAETGPVCGIQVNFMQGGLLFVIFLHRSVADTNGITNILRTMSEDLPSRTLTEEDLLAEVERASACRRSLTRFSGLSPTPQANESSAEQQQQQQQWSQQALALHTDTNIAPSLPPADDMGAALFMFKLAPLVTIAQIINGHRAQRHKGPDPLILVSSKQVLMALCWRAIARAKYPHGTYHDTQNTTISFAANTRNVMNLEADYLGNAEVVIEPSQSINQLILPYDPTNIESSVDTISTATLEATSEPAMRAFIGSLNDPAATATSNAPADLVFSDWSGTLDPLEFNELDLGLGFGRTMCVRRIGRALGAEECVIMPVNVLTQAWEVQIEIPTLELNSMRQDEEFMKFVWAVAGG